MGRVWLVHGIKTKPANKLDALADELRQRYGYDVEDFDYGHTGLLTRYRSHQAAITLHSVARLGDVAIGHSNGCSVIHRACALGAPFGHVIWIAPALDSDIWIPRTIGRVDVFATENDWVVGLAKFIPFSRWGAMGRDGYLGSDPRVRTHRYDWIPGHSSWLDYRFWLASRIDRLLQPRREGVQGRCLLGGSES